MSAREHVGETRPVPDDEQVLGGGQSHVGAVVRVGDTVHRPRSAGADLVESLLVHLERVGFDGAPRFLGIDDAGRQVLTFVEGDVTAEPPWLLDEEANLEHLVRVVALVRRLHEAAAGFVAPADASPRRRCPVPGTTWLHADVHYGNVVFSGHEPVTMIDWDFAGPGDARLRRGQPSLLGARTATRPSRPTRLARGLGTTRARRAARRVRCRRRPAGSSAGGHGNVRRQCCGLPRRAGTWCARSRLGGAVRRRGHPTALRRRMVARAGVALTDPRCRIPSGDGAQHRAVSSGSGGKLTDCRA